MLPIVYFNGEYLPKEQATLNVSDLSILRAYGIFDYFRYLGGKPRFMKDHIERFFNSAAGILLDVPISRDALAEVVHQLIEHNGGGDGGIRFVMTGGYSENGYVPSTPNLVAMAYPFTPPPASQFEQGCSVLLHHYERQLPRIKTIDYLEGIRLIPTLRAAGADYPLYVDRDDNVRESDRSNFFIVKNDTLITPIDDVLLGITRKHLIRLAKSLDPKVAERKVSSKELLEADEAIIASSTKGAVPIVKVDGKLIGGGMPGPVTRRLMEAWKKLT
jgi:branched-subunit amino acid aminotransferase/4-amino-4-deoxychorismate lyase